MYYMLIGFIIVVIAVIGAGYILKRKHYQRINELEEKKFVMQSFKKSIDKLLLTILYWKMCKMQLE